MPRYSQSTPTFTAGSFEEYLKPLEAYANTYNTLTNAIDATQGVIDTIPQYLDSSIAGDKELLERYNGFQGDLDRVATAVSQGNLRDMMNLARGLTHRYNRELAPIAAAYQKKQEAIKTWDAMRANDKSLIGTSPRGKSVKDYLNGASPEDFYVSGNELYAMGAADSKAESARRIIQTAWRLNPKLANQFFSRAIDTGFKDFNTKEISKRILAGTGATENDSAALKDALDYVQSAMNRIGDTKGISNLGKGSDNYKLAQSYLLNGILSGIGYAHTDEYKNNEAYDPFGIKYWSGKKAEVDYYTSLQGLNPQADDIPVRGTEYQYSGTNANVMDAFIKTFEQPIFDPTGEFDDNPTNPMQAYIAMHKDDLTEEELEFIRQNYKLNGRYVTGDIKGVFGKITDPETISAIDSIYDKVRRQDRRHELYGPHAVSEDNIKKMNEYMGKPSDSGLPSLQEIQTLLSVDPESNRYKIPSITVVDHASPGVLEDFGQSLYSNLLDDKESAVYRTTTTGGKTSTGTIKVKDLLEAIGKDGKGIRKVDVTPYTIGEHAGYKDSGKSLLIQLQDGTHVIIPIHKFGTEVSKLLEDDDVKVFSQAIENNEVFGSGKNDTWNLFSGDFSASAARLVDRWAKAKGYNFQQRQPATSKDE